MHSISTGWTPNRLQEDHEILHEAAGLDMPPNAKQSLNRDESLRFNFSEGKSLKTHLVILYSAHIYRNTLYDFRKSVHGLPTKKEDGQPRKIYTEPSSEDIPALCVFGLPVSERNCHTTNISVQRYELNKILIMNDYTSST